MTNNKEVLLVFGYPPSTKPYEIRNLFSNHGKIQRFIFKHNYSSIKFSSSDVYKELLKKKVFFANTCLKLILRTEKKVKSTIEDILTTQELNELVDKLRQEPNEEYQLQILLNEIQLPYHIMQQKYGQLCSDLDEIINMHIPGCKIFPFGSTMMGLSLRKSDIDIYVATPTNNIQKDKKESIYWVEKVKTILNKSNQFKQNIAITNASIPLIKCCHRSSETMCDISFTNLFGVINSNLVKFLLSFSERLQPTLLILKYWAKTQKLTGHRGFTNYALVMLFVFSLQQPEINILPAINKLQSQLHSFIIEGWDAGFNNNYYSLDSLSYCITIPKLLNHFFNFYSNFDYEQYVILPYAGIKMLKSDFNNVDNLPECFFRYKNLILNGQKAPIDLKSCICTQDPFEQNRNITKNMDLNQLNKFKECCKKAFELCNDIIKEDKINEFLPVLLSMSKYKIHENMY